MRLLTFKGFAGVRIQATVQGEDDAPPVLIIHGAAQTSAAWANVAAALELAGRKVVSLDLRGHGASEWPSDGRYDIDALVDDIKAALAQMLVRPVILAGDLGGTLAAIALGEEGVHLAAGLVLVESAARLNLSDARTLGDALRAAGIERVSPDWDPRVLDGLRLAGLADRLDAALPRLALPVLSVTGGDSALPVVAQRLAAVPGIEHAAMDGPVQLGGADGAEALNGVLLDFLERRIPLAAPEYREGSDARTFRDALGCFATGVTIVTAMTDDGAPVGLTANSFTSVSLDPPLLLVCIANGAGSAPAIRAASRFAVNVLQIGQQPTSNRFAGKGEDRFAATPWEVGEFGTPVLTGSLASFECATDAVHPGGDHFILVGRVLRVRFEPRRDPLLYFRGKYRRLHFA